MANLLKCVKNLCQKLKELKYPKSTISKVDNSINLLILRDEFTDKSTIGKLYLDAEMFCYTLELPYLDNQRSISCIPVGEYKVRLRTAKESASRDYLHLLVQDVTGRSYILVHMHLPHRLEHGTRIQVQACTHIDVEVEHASCA